MSNSSLHGAKRIPLEAAACKVWLDWLTTGAAPEQTHSVRWALAHCDKGVTWGFFDATANHWHLGSEADKELCPIPTAEALHELRLFGDSAEVLIWRSEDGLCGRILIDVVDTTPEVLQPFNEPRLLRGAPQEGEVAGFKSYISRGGARQFVPSLFASQSFGVRHYLEEDPETGSVRIHASRLTTKAKTL